MTNTQHLTWVSTVVPVILFVHLFLDCASLQNINFLVPMLLAPCVFCHRNRATVWSLGCSGLVVNTSPSD